MPWPVIIRRGRVIVCESQNHRAPAWAVGRLFWWLFPQPPKATAAWMMIKQDKTPAGPHPSPAYAAGCCCCCVHHQVSDHPAAAAPVVDGLVGA